MVLGQPTNKCEHGVFKGNEETARYCGFCNPGMAFFSTPRALTITRTPIIVAPPREEEVPEVLDCVEFQRLSFGQRLASRE